MPKQHDGEGVISETGNWNVADSYTKIKIMKPLALCDIYEDIASFGYESIIEELAGFQRPPNDLIRFNGLKRLIYELIKLIHNAKFALRIKGTKTECLKYLTHLIKLKNSLPNLVEVTYDQISRTSNFRIKSYSIFEQYLNLATTIKSRLNEPLNRNHLIFVDKEEFDPIAFKDGIKRRMKEQG